MKVRKSKDGKTLMVRRSEKIERYKTSDRGTAYIGTTDYKTCAAAKRQMNAGF